MGLNRVTVLLDIDDVGVIQGYKVCNTNLDTILEDPSLERLFSGKQQFNCPFCNNAVELIMYLSGLQVESLNEQDNAEEMPENIAPKQSIQYNVIEAIENLPVDNDFELADEIDFEDQYDEDVVELKSNKVEEIDIKQHFRAVRIVKEQIALANEEFKCENCKECFMYKAALISHEKKCLNRIQTSKSVPVQDDNGFFCSKCLQKFKSKAGLVMHEKSCQGNTVPFCTECQTEYKSQLALNKHIRAVHQPILYRCEECGDVFKKKWLLDEHILKHTTAKPYSCHYCNKRFAGKGAIKLHILSTHSTHFNGYQCSLCKNSYIYPTKSKLRAHITKVHSNNDCICVTCCKLFKSAKEMNSHAEAKHTNIGLEQLFYKCGHCDFSTTVRSTIENHQLSHVPSSEWPFFCATCGKRFKKKDNCRRHETIHSGEKNYSCEICSATFRLRYQVTQHMAVHRSSNDKLMKNRKAFKKWKRSDENLDVDHSSKMDQNVVIE